MKIIQPYMRMLTRGVENLGTVIPPLTTYSVLPPLQLVEWCGRISHRSEEEQKADSTEKFLRAVVIGHGDWSITEHVQVSVDAVVDRGITHEIVRHRIAAYTQESTRFVNYAKKMPPAFIYPKPDVRCAHCLNGDEPMPVDSGYRAGRHDILAKWEHDIAGVKWPCAYATVWLGSIAMAEDAYINLLYHGWRPQEARSVFPNALASRIIITYNLRTWRHFFLMRTSLEAHPQMRQVTIPLLREFQQRIPVLYEDIEPEQRQIENMKKAR